MKRTIIFEFKYSRNTNESLDHLANAGLQQIITKKYALDFLNKGRNCILIGVAFRGKEMSEFEIDYASPDVPAKRPRALENV